MKKVAVIILNWNGESYLREFLPSVVEFTPANLAEIIVADNGSSDGSIQLLKEEFPNVGLIAFDRNYGFCDGYNKAISNVNNKYVVLLNSDVAVSEDWLTPIIEIMERDENVAACQPKIKSLRDPERFEYAGACGGFIDANGYPYCRGRIFDTIEIDNGQYNSVIDIDWASGACLVIRRDTYINVGGLDASFFAHMEEIDLCWRLRRLGMSVKCVPQRQVFHLGGGSLDALNPRKTYLNFRNNLLMMHKNLSRNVRRKIIFRRQLLDALAWTKFIVTGRFAHAQAIILAHHDYRKMSLQYATEGTAGYCGHGNILLQYYMYFRRTFSSLPARMRRVHA